jgi:hypothetical protein
MHKNKISKEAAQEQVDLFMDLYDIDPDFLPENRVSNLKTIEMQNVKNIMRGRVEIKEEDGQAVITQFLTKPIKAGQSEIKQLVYKNFGATAKMEMDKVEGEHAKINALLSSMCNESTVTLQKMKGIDQSVAEMIGSFFMYV